MKKFATSLMFAAALATTGMAAEIKGFVEDQSCAAKPAMKEDAECAKRCIKRGTPAVVVAEDGKIYKVANQDKIVAHAGEKVTVTGKVEGDTITIEDVK